MPAEWTTSSPQQDVLRGEGMRTPDEVAAMLRLWSLGWGTKRIAAEFGCSRNTVKRYVAAGGWSAYRRPVRSRTLAGLEEWLAERFRRQGVGQALVTEVESWAQAQGSAYVSLASRRAGEFYRALAYEDAATFFKKPLDSR